jgi:hypothetical protein
MGIFLAKRKKTHEHHESQASSIYMNLGGFLLLKIITFRSVVGAEDLKNPRET